MHYTPPRGGILHPGGGILHNFMQNTPPRGGILHKFMQNTPPQAENEKKSNFHHFFQNPKNFSTSQKIFTTFLKIFPREKNFKKSKILIFSAIFTSHIYKKYFFYYFFLYCVTSPFFAAFSSAQFRRRGFARAGLRFRGVTFLWGYVFAGLKGASRRFAPRRTL